MTDRTIIVTGATKGLGRAIALAFAAAGHRIIGTYANDDAAADVTHRELQSFNSKSAILKHDVRNEFDTLWGSLEVSPNEKLTLINNACASFVPTPFHLVRWDEVQHAIDVGLKGSWQFSQSLLRPMIRARNGTIVNILTTAVHGIPPKGFSAYLVAKHAIRGLTLAMAAEYSAKGIRVFSVSPGFMKTALTERWDHRLVESMHDELTPEMRASKIQELIEDESTAGQGEDYPV